MGMTRRIVGLVCALALAGAACAGEGESSGSGRDSSRSNGQVGVQPAKSNTVSVVATEYGFEMPSEVAGGVVSFALSNAGAEHHEFAFGRLEGGMTFDRLVKHMKKTGQFKGAEDLAGVPLLSPGDTVTMTRDLDPGTYFFLCFFPTPQGEPHMAHGMLTSFEVVDDGGATMPEAELEIVATNDGFEVPDFTEGPHVVAFRNEGTKPHEFVLVQRVREGAGTGDFERWMADGQKGEAPVAFPGGMQSIAAGSSVLQKITFEPGDYLLEDLTNKLRADFTIP
jgi:hypothetical protein